ncbi:MAG: TlpA family protein disulfide reductase [Methylibium sp.]|uniref:TlpA disulfide reductase family protein n=1 Tax=Methylibium sp. TaxID=2067992 RepID=UPI0017D81123|nr:TlpA disulfide reductase family protein [Methylibium sp.]MBA3595992.1 TlpA family protein disulfide reductase [Methylibium sp.]
MKALTILLAALAAVATWVVFGPPLERPQAAPPLGYLAAKGDAFFAASFKQIGSSVVPLQTLRGKPVVAYFWASWCAKCREELKAVQALQDQYRDRGLVVVGFGIDQVDRIERFAREAGIDYPVFAGGPAAIALSKRMGNLREEMPFAVAIDREGLAAASRLGEFEPATAQALAAAALR